MFTALEDASCSQLVALALTEDLGAAGDLTSESIIPPEQAGHAAFFARSPGVVAGLPAAALVWAAVDSHVEFRPEVADGANLGPGDRLAAVVGPMRSILAGERTALNFLQRLSGVATLTRRYVEAVAGLSCRILDTRKTTPAWRLLEKYAVRCGGGSNHRMGLFDGVLIKDNHLAAIGASPEAIAQAVTTARARVGRSVPLEVEVDDLSQFDQALAAGPDVVLLDNMTIAQLREAVHRRNERAPAVRLEASGGVTLANVRAVAESGIDCVSVGALTHSAPALDIALDYLA